MHRQKLPFVALVIMVLVIAAALFNAQTAAAKVDLHGGNGETIWFYRSCKPVQPGTMATWTVEPNPSVHSRTSLNFQVKNAYPGYQLVCELYFANTGKSSIRVKEISVYNPNSKELLLSAALAPGESKKIVQPCGGKPGWGKSPASLFSKCWSKIKVTLTIGPNVKENIRLNFAIWARLEEKPGYH